MTGVINQNYMTKAKLCRLLSATVDTAKIPSLLCPVCLRHFLSIEKI